MPGPGRSFGREHVQFLESFKVSTIVCVDAPHAILDHCCRELQIEYSCASHVVSFREFCPPTHDGWRYRQNLQVLSQFTYKCSRFGRSKWNSYTSRIRHYRIEFSENLWSNTQVQFRFEEGSRSSMLNGCRRRGIHEDIGVNERGFNPGHRRCLHASASRSGSPVVAEVQAAEPVVLVSRSARR